MKRWSSIARRVLRRIRFGMVDLMRRLGRDDTSLLPPAHLAHRVGGDFEGTGREFLAILVEHAGARGDMRVLDIGCGVGRIAVQALPHVRPPGSYDGFDIDPAAIRWCQRRLTPRNPAFRFAVADVRNSSYNPHGAQDAASFRFPYPDASFDLTFATSVFTHLLPGAMENYLREAARVTALGGRVLATFFLLDNDVQARLAEGRCHVPLPVDRGWYRVADADVPEAAVAFDEARVLRAFAAAGLTPRRPILYGTWSGRASGTSFQDIVIAERDRRT